MFQCLGGQLRTVKVIESPIHRPTCGFIGKDTDPTWLALQSVFLGTWRGNDHCLQRGGGDWERDDVMDYVHPDEFMNSRRFGASPIESQEVRPSMDGKSRTGAYGALKMQ